MSNRYEKAQEKVNRIADALDARFRIPKTNYRFGWDGLIGLIPGSDLFTVIPGLYILFEARRLSLPKLILIRMAFNLLIDTLVGLIPVVGDFFDFAFKANTRNARLFEKGVGKLRDQEVIDV